MKQIKDFFKQNKRAIILLNAYFLFIIGCILIPYFRNKNITKGGYVVKKEVVYVIRLSSGYALVVDEDKYNFTPHASYMDINGEFR